MNQAVCVQSPGQPRSKNYQPHVHNETVPSVYKETEYFCKELISVNIWYFLIHVMDATRSNFDSQSDELVSKEKQNSSGYL